MENGGPYGGDEGRCTAGRRIDERDAVRNCVAEASTFCLIRSFKAELTRKGNGKELVGRIWKAVMAEYEIVYVLFGRSHIDILDQVPSFCRERFQQSENEPDRPVEIFRQSACEMELT